MTRYESWNHGMLSRSLMVMAGLVLAASALSAQAISLQGSSDEGHNLVLSGNLGAFAVNGHKVGRLTGIIIRKIHQPSYDQVNLRVRLDHPSDLESLNECAFIMSEDHKSNDWTSVRCVRPSELDDRDYAAVGTIAFLPKGTVETLYAPADESDRPAGRVERVSGSDTGGSLQFSADQAGAVLVVRDHHGRAMVQLIADSSRAYFRVRDSSGAEVVRIRADSSGFSGRVRSDGRN